MYCVGLTGNIGSGKSTVSHFFKEAGIEVINADEAARELTAVNQPALKEIKNHFGHSIIKPSGELNRSALREVIFKDSNQRVWLEQLLHPLIRQGLQNKIKESQSPYTVIEIPLLNKRSDYPYLDRILLVIASFKQQIARIMHRDQNSLEQTLAILATQPDNSVLRGFADDIIANNGSLTDLEKKIKNLHQQYLQLARQKS
jgi:dephospho-CoA kinase